MNLIVDIGNTNIKLAVYNHAILLEKQTVSYDAFVAKFDFIIAKYVIIKGIISSVGRLEKSVENYIQTKVSFMTLTHRLKFPFVNLYKTPQTLGVDRLALVCAAVKNYKNKNVLVIDAGTCITYDVLTSDAKYIGGAISPGVNLRYKALYDLTANLPLLNKTNTISVTGTTTDESIHSGVYFGICHEIDGIVSTYKTKYKDLTVILTGGDADFLSKRLKNSIFVNSNFLLEGLNYILEFNTAQ